MKGLSAGFTAYSPMAFWYLIDNNPDRFRGASYCLTHCLCLGLNNLLHGFLIVSCPHLYFNKWQFITTRDSVEENIELSSHPLIQSDYGGNLTLMMDNLRYHQSHIELEWLLPHEQINFNI